MTRATTTLLACFLGTDDLSSLPQTVREVKMGEILEVLQGPWPCKCHVDSEKADPHVLIEIFSRINCWPVLSTNDASIIPATPAYNGAAP